MPVIEDANALPGRRGTVYPLEFAEGFDGRFKRALTEALGLTQFGVNLTTLEPGAKSSQRHCHSEEDEFVYVLAGEIVLITDEGERVLKPGMAAGFPRGDGNAHQLVNRGGVAATYLEVGTRSANDDVSYPDIDMVGRKREGKYRFFHRNGEPYP